MSTYLTTLPAGTGPARQCRHLACTKADTQKTLQVCASHDYLPIGTALSVAHPTGPWFSTQLILSLSIGVTSFFTFCFLRTRWEVVYMARTKLKGETHQENVWG